MNLVRPGELPNPEALPPAKRRVPKIPGLSREQVKRVRKFLLSGLGPDSWPSDERWEAASGRFGVGVEVLRRAFRWPRRGRDGALFGGKLDRALARVRAGRRELHAKLAKVREFYARANGYLAREAAAGNDEALLALTFDVLQLFGPVPEGSRALPSWFAEAAIEGVLGAEGALALGPSRKARRKILSARLGERRRPRRRLAAERAMGRAE